MELGRIIDNHHINHIDIHEDTIATYRDRQIDIGRAISNLERVDTLPTELNHIYGEIEDLKNEILCLKNENKLIKERCMVADLHALLDAEQEAGA